jgi:hypothetical protein
LDSCPKSEHPITDCSTTCWLWARKGALLAGQYPLCIYLPIALSTASQGTHCSTAATIVSQMAFCFKFSTKILYALLNHPKRAIHPLHFIVIMCNFLHPVTSPPPPPIPKHKSPQPFVPTSPQTVQYQTAFNTISVGTACSSLKHSYCTIHATCFDTVVSSLDA